MSASPITPTSMLCRGGSCARPHPAWRGVLWFVDAATLAAGGHKTRPCMVVVSRHRIIRPVVSRGVPRDVWHGRASPYHPACCCGRAPPRSRLRRSHLSNLFDPCGKRYVGRHPSASAWDHDSPCQSFISKTNVPPLAMSACLMAVPLTRFPFSTTPSTRYLLSA